MKSAFSTSGGRSRRWRSRARAAGPSLGSKASHSCESSRAPAIRGAATDGIILGEEGDQVGFDGKTGQRPRRLAADRRIDPGAIGPEKVEGTTGLDLAVVAAALGEQVDQLPPLRRPPVGPVCRLGQHRRDRVVESHLNFGFRMRDMRLQK